MNCKEVADKLSQFMDGELDSALNERVSLHIESCDACKKDLESFRRIGVWMREVEAPVDTEVTWNRIEAAIPSKMRLSERRLMKWIVPALALAASVGFVVARVVWYPTNGTNSPHEHAVHEHGSLAVDFLNVIEFAQSETQCSGTQCRIIESAGQLAVSWRQKDRQFTMVGATDVDEVSQWVETLKL